MLMRLKQMMDAKVLFWIPTHAVVMVLWWPFCVFIVNVIDDCNDCKILFFCFKNLLCLDFSWTEVERVDLYLTMMFLKLAYKNWFCVNGEVESILKCNYEYIFENFMGYTLRINCRPSYQNLTIRDSNLVIWDNSTTYLYIS